jgi:hypothetical protein
MDALERSHTEQAKEIASLHTAISRVEASFVTFEKVSEMQFKSLDSSITALRSTVEPFMRRIDGMLTGEVETSQQRDGRRELEDYRKWRDGVDDFISSARTIGNVTKFLVGGQVLTIFVAIAALIKP